MNSKDIIRPDWTHTKIFSNKLNLKNNVSVDHVLMGKMYDKISTKIVDKLFEYPDESITYKILSDFYKINQKNICIGYGSTDLLNRILSKFSGKSLLSIEPTFEMIQVYCKIHNISYKKFSYQNFDEIDANIIVDNDVVYIANPNGNNGHKFSEKDIVFMLNNNRLVIVDEAYVDFSDGESSINLINNFENLIVTRTFSKSLGVAGIRCGFCVSNEKFIKELQFERENYVSTSITNLILSNFIHEIPESVERLKDSKKFLSDRYEVMNKHGNFVCIKNGIEDFDFCEYKKVEDYFRITLTNRSVFESFLL